MPERAHLDATEDEHTRRQDLCDELGMWSKVPEVVDETCNEQQRAATDKSVEPHIVRAENQNCRGARCKNGDAAQQRSRFTVPAVFSGKSDELMPTSPTGNKWGQCGRDTEGDSKTTNKSEDVARKQQVHRG